jgi:hypothetical protein
VFHSLSRFLNGGQKVTRNDSVGLNLDYKTLMGRGNFGDVLRVVWGELKKQVVKIRTKVDKARFQWLVSVVTVYYSVGTLLVICNNFR